MSAQVSGMPCTVNCTFGFPLSEEGTSSSLPAPIKTMERRLEFWLRVLTLG